MLGGFGRTGALLFAMGGVALCACRGGRKESSQASAASSGAKLETTSVSAKSRRLPEDPVLAKKSTAQWREHLKEEERHRRLCYDRDRLDQHQAVRSAIDKLRERYDNAKTKASIAKASSAFSKQAAGIRKQMDAIDHWKNSSMVLGDYDAVLKVLAEPYPTALLKSLDGEQAALRELRSDLDSHANKIRAWLSKAATCEDE